MQQLLEGDVQVKWGCESVLVGTQVLVCQRIGILKGGWQIEVYKGHPLLVPADIGLSYLTVTHAVVAEEYNLSLIHI